MLRSLALPVGLGEIVRRTYRDALDDDVLGLGAQLAYYFFLALFPAILFLLALASFFPLGTLTDDLGRLLGPFVSHQVLELIQDQMRRLGESQSGGLLTFGVLGALWSSSAAMVSIVDALNRAYDITEARPWWKVRLVALALTLGLAVFVLSALTLVLAGPTIAEYLDERAGFGSVFRWTWLIFQWPLAFLLVSSALAAVYYFGPDAEQDWVWVTPGALVATILWFLTSLGFKLYVAMVTDYTASYGAAGGVIVVLLWFYVSGIAIVIGAEMNAEIEHASPYGKEEGMKTAAGRRVIGARAARLFDERRAREPASDEPSVRLLPAAPGAGASAAGALVAGPLIAYRLWRRFREGARQPDAVGRSGHG